MSLESLGCEGLFVLNVFCNRDEFVIAAACNRRAGVEKTGNYDVGPRVAPEDRCHAVVRVMLLSVQQVSTRGSGHRRIVLDGLANRNVKTVVNES